MAAAVGLPGGHRRPTRALSPPDALNGPGTPCTISARADGPRREGGSMSKMKPERWLAFALLALTISVALQQLTSGSLTDFLAGLSLGLALALNVGYLLVFDRGR
jgi:hypothetical protein